MNNSVDEKNQEEFDLALMILGASKGDMNDQYELANAYKKGLYGLAKDTHRALYWFKKSANNGKADAIYGFWSIYAERDDPESKAKAEIILEKLKMVAKRKSEEAIIAQNYLNDIEQRPDEVKQNFLNYLQNADYAQTTCNAYVSSVLRVCAREELTLPELRNEIARIVMRYDFGGEEEEFGSANKRIVINALKRFSEFCAQ